MTLRLRTLRRGLAVLACGLAFGLAAPVPTLAQDDPNAPTEEGEGSGMRKPIFGYIAYAVLASGILFIVCKSSRR